MPDIRKESGIEWQPKHEDVETRAYEIYLRDREDRHAIEHWLIAEEGLRQEHATQREPVPLKAKTVVAGPGGVAKTSVDGQRSNSK